MVVKSWEFCIKERLLPQAPDEAKHWTPIKKSKIGVMISIATNIDKIVTLVSVNYHQNTKNKRELFQRF